MSSRDLVSLTWFLEVELFSVSSSAVVSMGFLLPNGYPDLRLVSDPIALLLESCQSSFKIDEVVVGNP